MLEHERVERALWLLPQIRPRMEAEEFLQVAREVDAFATLTYSKSKRITAADVEQHLRGMGLLAPVTTSSPVQRGDGVTASDTDAIYVLHDTPAPRKGMKV